MKLQMLSEEIASSFEEQSSSASPRHSRRRRFSPFRCLRHPPKAQEGFTDRLSKLQEALHISMATLLSPPTGILQLSSYRVSPVPLFDASGAVGDNGSKPGGCFGRDTIANAAAKVGPSVVNIAVPQGFRGITTGRSIGSGTIIDDDGTILTCAHVVVDFQGARSSSKGKIGITLQDGRTFEGKLVNADLHSDIAIVKINSETPLPEAKLSSSSRLRPGDWVIAMGCLLSL